MRNEQQVRQARTVFQRIFDDILVNWQTSEIELNRQLHDATMQHLGEVAILERRAGSTIYCFTPGFRTLLAEKMIDFVFPLDADEAPGPEKVIIRKNKNPGISLRIIKEAHRLIQGKLESSESVLQDLYPDKPEYTKVKVTHLVCIFVFMENGLFLVPEFAGFEGIGGWTAKLSREEINEFRVLIQA